MLSLAMLVGGFARGWASPYMAQLTAPDSTHSLKLTLSETSWITSLLFLGRTFGNLLCASIQEFIGRKKTLLYSPAPNVLGWTFIIIFPSIPWRYAGRLFSGQSMGMVLSTASSFLSEIADPKIRGTLIVLNIIMTLLGTFLGNIMGTFFAMEIFSYVSITGAALFVAFFFFVPQSPYYYISNGNIKAAEESLQWYMKTADVRRELQELQEFMDSSSVSLLRRLKELKKPEHRKNIMIVCCFNVFLFCAGENVVASYAEIILIKNKISVKPSTIVMALSLSNAISGFVASIFVDKFGRKPLLIISGLGLCTAHVLLGSHFHTLSLDFDPQSISWLCMFTLFLDYTSVAFGLSPVPRALVGELFPPILKTLATFCFYGSGGLLSFGHQEFPTLPQSRWREICFLDFCH